MSEASRLRLERKLDQIKRLVSTLGATVIENVQLAMRALELRDTKLGREVAGADRNIDLLEIDLEEQCLEILALHQPVATDLRFIVGVFKTNQDLERIGDMASNIGRIAVDLADERSIYIPEDYFLMGKDTVSMLKIAIESLVNLNISLAYSVLQEDDQIDLKKHRLHQEFEEKLLRHPENVRPLTHLFLVSRHLERIADHATNIAEDVIYMVTGIIRRHGK